MLHRVETADVALVSNAIPPGPSGYQQILEQLLGAIPEDRLATVGIGGPWGERPRVPFPARSSAPNRFESLLAAGAAALGEATAPRVLRHLFPRVRRIFTTLDPMLGLATSWARGTGAELWVYAIDLHAETYWRSGEFLRGRLHRWRDEAFAYATRVFALSDGMRDWLQASGVKKPIEILPPLFPVGERRPLPEGPTTFLMSGSVYTVNAGPLRWLERAVTELAPLARLRLVTATIDAELKLSGLDLTKWSRTLVAPAAVADEVARATWGVIGVDTGKPDVGLQVAWPTKLREYLGVGRPVLCISRPEYAVARLVTSDSWGVLAFGEEQTRAAVARIVAETPASLLARSEAAHRFARERMDDARIGSRFRRELCAV
jgi:hypothetical protein